MFSTLLPALEGQAHAGDELIRLLPQSSMCAAFAVLGMAHTSWRGNIDLCTAALFLTNLLGMRTACRQPMLPCSKPRGVTSLRSGTGQAIAVAV